MWLAFRSSSNVSINFWYFFTKLLIDFFFKKKGIATALFGLSLNELSYNINATIAQLSYGIFLKFIFSCSGSLAGKYEVYFYSFKF